MKGLVFTEFFDMVEQVFDADMVDLLIENTQPASQGAYTTVGSYPYEELEAMVVELSKQTNMEVTPLLVAFGKHLGAQFAHKYPHFFKGSGSTIGLLKEIDDHIHVEVRKLYPDAELPEFSFDENTAEGLFILHYRSNRPLADLAHGLIMQTSQHYQENFKISLKKWQEKDKHCCEFLLAKAS